MLFAYYHKNSRFKTLSIHKQTLGANPLGPVALLMCILEAKETSSHVDVYTACYAMNDHVFYI